MKNSEKEDKILFYILTITLAIITVINMAESIYDYNKILLVIIPILAIAAIEDYKNYHISNFTLIGIITMIPIGLYNSFTTDTLANLFVIAIFVLITRKRSTFSRGDIISLILITSINTSVQFSVAIILICMTIATMQEITKEAKIAVIPIIFNSQCIIMAIQPYIVNFM